MLDVYVIRFQVGDAYSSLEVFDDLAVHAIH